MSVLVSRERKPRAEYEGAVDTPIGRHPYMADVHLSQSAQSEFWRLRLDFATAAGR
jgi:hypothetical protein